MSDEKVESPKLDDESQSIQQITRQLAEPFDPKEVKWKPQSVKGDRALAVCYVDSRLIQDRLDEVVGVENWKDDYTILEGGSVMCQLSVRFGSEWIHKVDVGSPSEQPDGGDRMKAAFSDALKRTAVKFGIGRYLYRIKSEWWDWDRTKKKFVKDPLLPDFALPYAMQSGKKQQPKKSKSDRPKTGNELLERLKKRDALLAEDGKIKPGELVEYITKLAKENSFPMNSSQWSDQGIDAIIKWTKQFMMRLEKPEDNPNTPNFPKMIRDIQACDSREVLRRYRDAYLHAGLGYKPEEIDGLEKEFWKRDKELAGSSDGTKEEPSRVKPAMPTSKI